MRISIKDRDDNASRQSSKGRKFGRASRSPSMAKYVLANARAVNKRRRVERHLKASLCKAIKRNCRYDKGAEEWLVKNYGLESWNRLVQEIF